MTGKLLNDCFLHDRDRMRHTEVLALLRDRLSCVTAHENVALSAALGRVAHADVQSTYAIPQADNAAVDGFAIRHSDLTASGGRLPIHASHSAGAQPPDVPAGYAVRIFTGAVMPPGLDTVAMSEDCTLEGGVVTLPTALKVGANRRERGEDVMPGEVILTANHVVTPAHIAALAACGCASVAVRAQLRVAILSTGNEIIPPGKPAAAHEVYDANRPMLAALLQHPSIATTDLGHVPDDEPGLRAILAKAAASHDVIVTTGGASRGDEDHMLTALDTLGNRHMWQIAIKPGRPMMFGQIGDCVVLGLPGNPVAAFVCTVLYARHAMARLMGISPRGPRPIMAPAGFEIASKKPDRREFLRGWIGDDGTAQKFARDGSGLISGLRAAGGLIELPEDVTSVQRGDPVRYLRLSDFQIAHEDQP
ncbi:MAG: gephyrin-like molybdotransferase Glp [Pseudomonadota bacterium]